MATQLHVFHIAFRDYLQEQILPKMKRPPLIVEDEWDPGEETSHENTEEEQQEGAYMYIYYTCTCTVCTCSYVAHVHTYMYIRMQLCAHAWSMYMQAIEMYMCAL